MTSTMDTQCTGSSSAGPLEGPSASAWGAQRNRPGATKGQVDIWAEKNQMGFTSVGFLHSSHGILIGACHLFPESLPLHL